MSRRARWGTNVASSILFALAMPAVALAAAEPVSKESRNKAIALRVFEEIFNQGRFGVADEIYARDFSNHGLRRDVDLKVDQDAVHAEKQAFPDLKMSVEMMIAEGDLVTALWVFRGTHTAGGYEGLPPTGARIEMRGITIWRIVDGKIRDEWTSFNELGAWSQVVAHLRWPLLIALLAFLALVVIAERTLFWVAKQIHVKLKG